jgi:hypothetical protein
VLTDFENALRLNPTLLISTLLIALVLFFVLGVLIGNVTAMKILVRLGIPVLSGKVVKDYRVHHSLNKDVLGWLQVPNVCYAPIMSRTDGFYKTHNALKKENSHGEIFLSDGKNSFDLRAIALQSKNSFPDLSIIVGSAEVRSTSTRSAQFTCLKKYVITDLKSLNPDIYILDNGRLRVFNLLFATEMGLETKQTIKFTDRVSFIKSMRELSYLDTGRSADDSVIILSGSTDIDTMLVFLVEKKEV